MNVIKGRNRTYLLIAACIAAAIPSSTHPVFIANRYLIGLGAGALTSVLGKELYSSYGTNEWQNKLFNIGCGFCLGALINDAKRQEEKYMSQDQSLVDDLTHVAAVGCAIEATARLSGYLNRKFDPNTKRLQHNYEKRNQIRRGGMALLGGMFVHELLSGPVEVSKKKLPSDLLKILMGKDTDLGQENDSSSVTLKKVTDTYTFKNLAGKIPQDVIEITDFIKNKETYDAIGAVMPKGILLVGPPGTGKTSIARAIAGEAKASFFATSGSQFLSRWIGEGERMIREVFEKARQSVRSGKFKKAIVFIDEIDSIGGARGDFSNKWNRGKLNELLAQLDGFSQDDSIFVIGATNRVQDLDAALTRSGRFDRMVTIDLPDEESRKAILQLWLDSIKSHNINITHLTTFQ